jgi:hypothetical protein
MLSDKPQVISESVSEEPPNVNSIARSGFRLTKLAEELQELIRNCESENLGVLFSMS